MEISTAGYQAVRNYVEANWQYIELRDNTNTAVLRLSITDPRVSWTHTPGAQTLQLTATIAGSDSDITLPTIIASSAVYDVATGGEALSVVALDYAFELETVDYQITVNHQIQIPEIM